MTAPENPPADAGMTDLVKELAYLVWKVARCERCHGSGTAPTRLGPDECPDCGGTGSSRLSFKEMRSLKQLMEQGA